MARKTVEVEKVRSHANIALAAKDSVLRLEDMTPEQAFRLGVASLLEQMLHMTGNYRGFQYLASEFNDNGTLRDNADETRRVYF